MKNLYGLFLISFLLMTSCSVNHLDPLETVGYAPQAEGIYYTIVTLKKTPALKFNDIRNKISAFNQSKGGAMEKLRPASIYLNSNDEVNAVPVITIRRFDTYALADRYAQLLNKFLKKNAPKGSTAYPIAQMNYRNLIRRQNVEEFKRYYELNIVSD